MEQPPKQNEMTVGEAVIRVTALMYTELAKGGVDIEKDQFVEIINKLEQGKINAQEALTLVSKIIEERQDYH